MARDYTYVDRTVETKVDNLSTFEPGINQVLVKPIIDTEKIGELGLIRDTYFNDMDCATRVVEVVKVPKGLACKGENGMDHRYPTALDWKTQMQLQPGDIAWVDPITVVNNNNTSDTNLIVHGKEIYFIIRYDRFVVAKRKDQTIPLIGYVVLEKIWKRPDSDLSLDVSFSSTSSVVLCGDQNLFYFNPFYSDEIDVAVGDRIETPNNIFALEGEMYDHFEKGKDYYVTQRKNILYNYGKCELGDREFTKGKSSCSAHGKEGVQWNYNS